MEKGMYTVSELERLEKSCQATILERDKLKTRMANEGLIFLADMKVEELKRRRAIAEMFKEKEK